jgi:hypothetical protein
MPGSFDHSTRRQILQAVAAASGTVAIGQALAEDTKTAGNGATDQSAPGRFTPEQVHYQGTPHDWQKCVFCSFFKEPNACGILTAPVSRNGWCEKFALLHE